MFKQEILVGRHVILKAASIFDGSYEQVTKGSFILKYSIGNIIHQSYKLLGILPKDHCVMSVQNELPNWSFPPLFLETRCILVCIYILMKNAHLEV